MMQGITKTKLEAWLIAIYDTTSHAHSIMQGITKSAQRLNSTLPDLCVCDDVTFLLYENVFTLTQSMKVAYLN